MRVLQNDLRLLGIQGGRDIVDGVLSMVGGGLLVGLGIALSDVQGAEYFYLSGGSMLALGLAELILAPNPSDAAVALDHMPISSEDQALAKLRFAEERLEEVAERARWMRVTRALVNSTVSVAMVPLFLAPRDYELASPLDYFLLIGGALGLIEGLVSLLTPSQAEKRWKAYVTLRERLAEVPR